jgi:hypothetical protein
MSDRPTSEMVVGTATVNGRELEIVRLTWSNTPGLSYDVYDKATGNCLTEESFGDYPTEEQINAAVKDAEDDDG